MHGIKSKLIIKILRGIGSFLWIISHIKSKNEVAISACDLVWESCHLFVPDQKPSLKVFFDSARVVDDDVWQEIILFIIWSN